MSKHKGIKLRHKKDCAKSPCSCTPSYRPTVYDRRDGRKVEGPTFRSLAEAKQWRTLKAADVERGKIILTSTRTFREVAEEFLHGADTGHHLNRNGQVFKPSVLRDYEGDLRQRILPELGARRIGELRRGDWQRFVHRLQAERLSGSRIRNILSAARAVYRYAISLDEVEDTPIKNITLPASRGRRERIADPVEARTLIAALPEGDRALWGVAVFSGLRAGEIRALRWQDVDLAAGTIRVERSWDDRAGAVDPKSESARRTVPIVGELRAHLVRQQLACAWSAVPSGLVFGQSPTRPFNDRSVTDRAKRAWAEAGLRPLGLHEARHSAASLFIAADVTPKQISTWLGHSGIGITYDVYGHLFPNANEEGVAKVDAYLTRMTG